MRTLTRYVIGEFTKVLIVTLLGMTVLILLVLIGREAVEQGLGPRPILRLVPYAFPVAMRFAVPGAVLLATTAVYGRMSAANEVLAIKSQGISPMTIIWPLVVVAAGISLATVWLNDVAVSWGELGVKRVILESAEETAYGVLRARKTFQSRRLAIHVLRVDGHRLIRPTIVVQPHRGRPGGTITADEAQLRADPGRAELAIELFNARVEFGDGKGFLSGTYRFIVSLSDFTGRAEAARGPGSTPLSEIPAAIAREEQTSAEIERSLAVQAVGAMTTGDFAGLHSADWQTTKRRLVEARSTLCRLRAEPHRRWATGLSCLCFAIVGAPMAIRRRHGEFLASFFVCFLPILLVYYPFLMVSVDHAKVGSWPPSSVWLGNVVLVVWGVWLLRGVIRY